jgi:hypothetical protein
LDLLCKAEWVLYVTPALLSVTGHFVCMGLAWFSVQTAIIYLNSVNKLIFVMVKCGVLFEVRTEFLNNI